MNLKKEDVNERFEFCFRVRSVALGAFNSGRPEARAAPACLLATFQHRL